MELKLQAHPTKDWLSKYIMCLSFAYTAFAILLLFRLETIWEKAIIWIGGGSIMLGYWINMFSYFSLRSGVLKKVRTLPFRPKEAYAIDLHTVIQARVEKLSLPVVEYGHLLPFLILTRAPGFPTPGNPRYPSGEIRWRLPVGRAIDEAEVQAFVRALNSEIEKAQTK